MSTKKEKRKRGYPFSINDPFKEKDNEEEVIPKEKSPPKYGVYKRD